MTPIADPRELLRRHPARFAQLHAFSFEPADYLHPTRRAAFAGVAPEGLWTHPRARRSLSALVLQRLGLAQRPCLDARHPELPIALLGPPALDLLARGIAAVLLAPWVRRSLGREQVLRWKSRLTPRLYEFALSSAALLPGLPKLPEVEFAPALPVETLGQAWICAGLSQASDEVRLRAELKLAAGTDAGAIDPTTARRLAGAVLSFLEPAWSSSFETR